MNDIASVSSGICTSYPIKYIGSRTGYAANCECRVSVVIPGEENKSPKRHTIEKSRLFGSNTVECGSPVWEGVNDLAISGNWMGDVKNGRQATSIPCCFRSSGVKGTASSSNPGWEKERVEGNACSVEDRVRIVRAN